MREGGSRASRVAVGMSDAKTKENAFVRAVCECFRLWTTMIQS